MPVKLCMIVKNTVFVVKRCPPLPKIRHAWLSTTATAYQTVVVCVCETGHQFPDGISMHSIICLTGQKWSPIPPECLRKYYYHLSDGTEVVTNYLPNASISVTIICQTGQKWSPITSQMPP